MTSLLHFGQKNVGGLKCSNQSRANGEMEVRVQPDLTNFSMEINQALICTGEDRAMRIDSQADQIVCFCIENPEGILAP